MTQHMPSVAKRRAAHANAPASMSTNRRSATDAETTPNARRQLSWRHHLFDEENTHELSIFFAERDQLAGGEVMGFDAPTYEIARVLVLHFDGALIPALRQGCRLDRNAVHVEAVRPMKLRVFAEDRIDEIDFVDSVFRRDVRFR
jgi:hypothetical protein